MKNQFSTFLFVIACLQACVVRINNPDRPPTPPPGGQPWWYDTDDEDDNSDQTTDTITVIIGDDTDDEDDEPETPTEPDTISDFVPTSKYEVTNIDGVLTFDVYLGWSIGAMNTSVLIRDFSPEGGEMVFNIYTNNLSMSMYGFEKWRKDFYTFSSEPPYCGYSSYSLDTQPVCKYKMIIKENNIGEERFCSGYWACNNGGSFYSSFKIILYQNFK